jgi:hypothetical protein
MSRENKRKKRRKSRYIENSVAIPAPPGNFLYTIPGDYSNVISADATITVALL